MSNENRKKAIVWHKLSEHPVLALGFRPFYLLGILFAVVALIFWLLTYSGLLSWNGYLNGLTWHSHEMIFGFAVAVIAGFLLTAVRNWTGQPTPSKAALAALVMLWLLGRIIVITGPRIIAPWIDLAFLPVLGFVIALPIIRSRNTRNFKLLFIVAALACLNTIFHLAYLNKLPSNFSHIAIVAALDIITLLMAIIGGRVIPAFTANAIPKAKPIQFAWIEVIAIGTLILVLLGRLLGAWYQIPSQVWFTLLTLAALIHLIRLMLWKPHATLSNPLLWMLPIAYCWIPISLGLQAYAQAFSLSPSIAIHALTLGAISGLMLAMIARSALGHTGRLLMAGPIEIIAFALIQIAAVVRVVIGFIDPNFYQWGVTTSGVFLSVGYFVFLIRYYPILTRPRVDGKPG